jgi:hypothetical protein
MSAVKSAYKLAVFALCLGILAIPGFADSQVRIVRLSDVQGEVQIDRNVGQGFEKAFLNLPITQGVKLRTKADGRVQIEFEDGSILRVTPDSVIEFPELAMRDSGAKVSIIHLIEGKTYINYKGTKNDQLTLVFGQEKIVLAQPAHLRLEMADAEAHLGVFGGNVPVEGPFGTTDVTKNHAITFDLADQSHYKTARWVDDDPYDAWDKQQDQYQQRYSTNAMYSNASPYSYGFSDLNYYGNFTNVPGYGIMWQPYLAGAGWDPFMNGAWAYYPGAGYGWVSGYPWGWMPYYSGAWDFVPGYGWMWQPGGLWGGLGGFPLILNAPVNFVLPRAPNLPGQRITAVNRTSVPAGTAGSSDKVSVSRNSAGLGIPRGGVKDLSSLSQTVQEHGVAIARVSNPSIVHMGGLGGYSGSPGYSAASSHSTGSYASSGGMSAHSSIGGGHAGGGHR